MENNRKKQSYQKAFKGTLQFFIQIMEEYTNKYNWYDHFIVVFSYIQILAYLFYNQFANEDENHVFKIQYTKFSSLYRIVFYFVRPTLLYQSLSKNYDDARHLENYGIALVIIAITCYLLFFFIIQKMSQYQDQSFKMISYILGKWYVISIIAYNNIFIMPLLEVSLYYITDGLSKQFYIGSEEKNSQSLIGTVILKIILTLFSITAIIIGILILYYGEQSIYITETSLRKFYLGYTHKIMLFYKISLIVVFIALQSYEQFNLYFMYVMMYVFLFLKIYDIFINLPYTNQLYIYNELYCQAIFFVMTTCSILYLLYDEVSEKNFFSVVVICSPIFMSLLHTTWNKYFNKIYYSQENETIYQNPKILLYKLATLWHYKDQLMNKNNYQEHNFKIFCLMLAHKNNCKQSNCFCTNEPVHFSYQTETGTHLNQQFLCSYILRYLELEIQSSSNLNSYTRQLLFLKYISCLRDLQLNTIATQKISLVFFRNNQHGLSTFSKLAINYHLNKIKENLKKHISNDSQTSIANQVFSEAVEKYIRSEKTNKLMTQECMDIMKEKLIFYEDLVIGRQPNVIISRYTQLLQNLLRVKSQLQAFYKNFPATRFKNLLCFFEAEICNNLFSAFITMNTVSQPDWKMDQANQFENHQQQFLQKMNLFEQEKVVSLVISYGKNPGKILDSSSSAAEFFHYDSSQFRYVQNMSDLIPISIRRVHVDLIENFLKSGECKFFKNIERSYIQGKSGYISIAEMAFDINFVIQNDFAFIVFFKEFVDELDTVHIICNENGLIEGVTSNFNVKFLVDQTQGLNLMETTYAVNINSIFPQFRIMLAQLDQQGLSQMHFENCKLFYLKDQMLIKSGEIQKIAIEQNRQQMLKSKNNQTIDQRKNDENNQKSKIRTRKKKVTNMGTTSISSGRTVIHFQGQINVPNFSKCNEDIVNEFNSDLILSKHQYQLENKVIKYYIIEVMHIKRILKKALNLDFISQQKTKGLLMSKLNEQNQNANHNNISSSTNKQTITNQSFATIVTNTQKTLKESQKLIQQQQQNQKNNQYSSSSVSLQTSVNELPLVQLNQANKQFLQNENIDPSLILDQISPQHKNIQQINLFTATGRDHGLRLIEQDYKELSVPQQVNPRSSSLNKKINLNICHDYSNNTSGGMGGAESENSGGKQKQKISFCISNEDQSPNRKVSSFNSPLTQRKRRSQTKTVSNFYLQDFNDEDEENDDGMQQQSNQQGYEEQKQQLQKRRTSKIQKKKSMPFSQAYDQLNNFADVSKLVLDTVVQQYNIKQDSDEEEKIPHSINISQKVPKIEGKKKSNQFIQNKQKQQHFFGGQRNLGTDVESQQLQNADNGNYAKYFKMLQSKSGLDHLPNLIGNLFQLQSPEKAKEQQIQLGEQEKESSIMSSQISEYFHKYQLYFKYSNLSQYPRYLNQAWNFLLLAVLCMFLSGLVFSLYFTQSVNKYTMQFELLHIRPQFLRSMFEMSNIVEQIGFLKQQRNQSLIDETSYLQDINMLQFYLQHHCYNEIKNIERTQFNNEQLSNYLGNSVNIRLPKQEERLNQLQDIQQQRIQKSESLFDIITIPDINSLYLLLNYLYQLTIIDIYEPETLIYNKPVPSQDYILLNYISYKKFLDYFEDKLFDYTRNLNNQQIIVLISTFISIVAITFTFLVLAITQFKKFILLQELALQFIFNSDKIWIQRETDKIIYLRNLIDLEQELIFKYQFDLQLKENFFQHENNIQQNYYNIQKAMGKSTTIPRFQIKLRFVNFMFVYILLFIVYITFGVSIQYFTYNFLNSQDTNMLNYQQYASTEFRVGELIYIKNCIYKYNNGSLNNYFINASLSSKNNDQISEAQEMLQFWDSELEKLITFQQKYISSFEKQKDLDQSFKQFLAKLVRINVCNDTLQLNGYEYYSCITVIDSSLQKGITSAFSYFITEFKTERHMNFIKKDLINNYDKGKVEGMLFLQDVLDAIREEIQNLVFIQANQISTICEVSTVMLMIFVLIIMLIYRNFYLKKYTSDYFIYKQSIFIIPAQTIVIDSRFFLRFRAYLKEFQFDDQII